MDKYLLDAQRHGAFWTKVVPAESVVTAAWVRLKCKFGCAYYNASLLCPPRTPTPEETAAVIKCYQWAMLAAWDTPPERDERRALRKKMHLAMLAMERGIFLDGYYKALAFVAGLCNLCPECDVNAECQKPGVPRPSMEACGIDVFTTMANAGYKLEVRTRSDQHYTMCGLILIE